MKRFQIFRSGTHTAMNGRTISFSDDDLQGIARAYNTGLHEAPIVIGHPGTDDPAYGWAGNVQYADGALSVDPVQVDPAFARMVDAGRFKKVSASFYPPDAAGNPAPGNYYLRHVGFLGAQPPAVKGLKAVSFSGPVEDCLTIEFSEERTGFSEYGDRTVASLFRSLREFVIEKFSMEDADRAVPHWQVSALNEEASQPDETVSPAFAEAPIGVSPTGGTSVGAPPAGGTSEQFSQPPKQEQNMPDHEDRKLDFAEREARLKEQTGELDERDAKLKAGEAAFAQRENRATAQAFLDPLVAAGKVLPAEQTGMVSFMAGLDRTGDALSFGEGDDARTTSPRAWFEGFLKGLDKRVAFSEASADDGEGVAVDGDPRTIAAAAVNYQEQQKRDGVMVSTTDAVRHVTKGEGQ